MESIIFPLLTISYFIGDYFLIRFLRHKLSATHSLLRITILSFVYAALFGLGILGSGGDPGFAMPFPILLTAIIYVWEWAPWVLFINGVIIPFIIWWTLIFSVMFLGELIKRRRMNRTE